MKKIISLLLVLFCMNSNLAYARISNWAEPEYKAASSAGLLTYNVLKNDLKGEITREEFCELVMTLYKSMTREIVKTPEIFPFDDCDSIPVAEAHLLGIVSGKSDTEFDPQGRVTRQEMAKMIVNTLKVSHIDILVYHTEAETLLKRFTDSAEVASWAYAELAATLKHSIISGMSETELAPTAGATREQAIAIINRVSKGFSLNEGEYSIPEFKYIGDVISPMIDFSLVEQKNAEKYVIIMKNKNGETVKLSENKTADIKPDISLIPDGKYFLTAGIKYKDGMQAFSFPQYVEKISSEIIEEDKQENPPLKEDEENSADSAEKENDNGQNAETQEQEIIKIPAVTDMEKRVFPGGYYFSEKEEADVEMVEISIDVWNVDENGEKFPAKKYLVVNKHLAEEIQGIFAEIFNSPEQFPIKSIGGYSWRETAFGKVSQHSYGTCIDINPDENYYCYASDGTAIVGNYWKPGEDIYSIIPEGSVVSAFKKRGWTWGGAWNSSVMDYMHFSYLGK